ncbi:POK8 protein, partial [Aramus guarauna]|nr:POK8 protein [Aramus guarauna]
LTVIDLKDCFFNIPLHPQDAPKFAFSIPSVNVQEPLRRFHWVVLPQGMKNSPTICQWYIAKILSPIRKSMPAILLYHYMDDILVAASHEKDMQKAVALVI